MARKSRRSSRKQASQDKVTNNHDEEQLEAMDTEESPKSSSKPQQVKEGKKNTPKPKKTKTPNDKKLEEQQESKKDVLSTTNPTIDLTVHRLRHLDYLPKHIVCMRATPDGSSLAIARENGSVELKAPNEKFRTIAEIAGFRKKLVNCLTWTCGMQQVGGGKQQNNNNSSRRPTCVGGSRDGSLFVVDFQSGLLTGMTPSGGGGIFALASLCQHQEGHCCVNGGGDGGRNACAQLLAAGCEDGSIRIYQVIEHKQLELVSTIPSASGASILSLAWKRLPTAPPGSSGCNDTVMFAGISDGTIRRYECVAKPTTESTSSAAAAKVGSWKSSLRMTLENQGRNTPTRVWALQSLADGTLISGDSLGHVQFWDGNTGTLLQTFDQNDNKADVLDIAVASQESKVFASGVDSRVVCIQRPPLEASTTTGEIDRKWIMSQAQRPHTHDVKSLTLCRRRITESNGAESRLPVPKTGYHELLCSGGLDSKLCTYFVEGFKKLRPKSLYPWPAFSPVAQARDKRVIILRREEKIDLYKLGEMSSPPPPNESYSVLANQTRIGTIELESTCNLVCATISDDGEYLATCDSLTLLLFRLEYVADSKGSSSTIIPTKLSMDTHFKASVVTMKFGKNGQLIAATSDGNVHVINLPSEEEESDTCTFAMTLKQKKQKAQHDGYLFPIQAIEFSKDKTFFATLQGGYDCSSVRVFAYEKDGATYRHWWSIPDLEAPISAIKFTEVDGLTQLVASCANFAFYAFDMKERKLSPWSEKSGVPISKNLPQELTSRNDYPVRITTNPAASAKVLLGSFGAFALIDLEKKLPQYCKTVPEHHVRRWRKRKRSASEAAEEQVTQHLGDVESIICLRYNSILHMDFIAENEMVVVEQPWLSVIANFPAALERKVYGS